MIKLGLVGKDISHSRSQEMYEKLLGHAIDYSLLDYQKEYDIESLDKIFDKGFLGISVTFPYKNFFISQVEIRDDLIRSLGAINCIKRVGPRFFATNTDFLAAKHLLTAEITKNKDLKFVILGSGNMAQVFSLVLGDLQKSFRLLSRQGSGDLNKIEYCKILDKDTMVINCCSRSFVFDSSLPDNTIFWDMNYSFPAHDALKEQNFIYREGDDLLYYQAKFALNFWEIDDLQK